ncbi:MAG TPA: PEP-utilizing enzyme [Patescibacteria group bacterium]|nr:PEP-utilizing enzyme [Patescibacteria group bacterium]
MENKLLPAAHDFHSPLMRNEIWIQSGFLWPELFDLPNPGYAIESHEDTIAYLLDMDLWNKDRAILQKRIEQNPEELDRLIECSEQWGQEMNRFTSQARSANLSSWSGTDLWNFYERFANLQARQYAVGILLPLLEVGGVSFLESFLKTFLASRLSPEEAARAFAVFTTPLKNSFALDQEDALLELAPRCFSNKACRDVLENHLPNEIPSLLQQSAPEISEALRGHAEKFGWVYYVYAGPAFGEMQFVEFLQDLLHKRIQPEGETQRKKEERCRLAEERKKYLEQLRPDESTKRLLLLVNEYVWAKPRRKDYQSHSYFHMESFFREFSRRFDVSLKHARSATQKQIREALLEGKIDPSVLDRQYKHHLVSMDERETIVISGNEAKQFSTLHVLQSASEEMASVSELSGSTAFPGTATGSVRLINRPEDMQKMQPGDILVSVATTPSIVTAMKKAAAIVTDEGGLTCHASIVSRELHIPCVVGTKIATKVLHDGDLVEVNADKGVVKKIG